MRKTLMGNQAAAIGAALARAEVVSAYPITPATQVVEHLAEMRSHGEFDGTFLKVESEHSAMAALIGASTTGARTFTATSSQGLAYMHELLHWASGARLPIVMVDVNRGLAAPWILGTDQIDSLSQRDTGWMQFYCADSQEVLDTVLMAYRISEQLLLPSMVVLEGFFLSHTYEPVDVPDREAVDRFLPPFKPAIRLDRTQPVNFGALPSTKEYFRLRRRLADDMERAKQVITDTGLEFAAAFGRSYDMIEPYRIEDADTLLVTSGAVGSTAKAAVDALRAEGHRAGALRIRVFRPFPAEALLALVRPGVPLAVVDRNFSMGSSGIFCAEIRSALFPVRANVEVAGFVAGLGGGDITVDLLKEIWHEARARTADERETVWMEDAR